MKRAEARKLAEALVARMTIEEKASQLRFDSPAIDRLGVPEYNWWNEALHGVARGGTATVFPQAIALAATFDDELEQKIGDAISTEARAKYNALSAEGDRDIYHGLTMWSPNINIFRDPRWGRGHETFGEDPYLTSRMGIAFVKGLQGSADTLKTAACAKHFAVHSGPEELRHHFDAIASDKDMTETYLEAFRALVQSADVEAVMGAYNRVNGEPACASSFLMNKLRNEWGFEGHFVSDCWAVRDFHEGHKVTSKPVESVKLALESGCDVNCGCTYQHILEAFRLGMIDEKYITESAVRLFTTRYMLGIMGEGSEFDAIPYTEIESRDHITLAHTAAKKSCVLLKNNGILPLSTDNCGTIGVIGPNANSRISLIGNYHGTSSRYFTVLEGIQETVGESCRVLYSEGCSLYKSKVENLAKDNDRIAEAVAVAKNSDTVILVLGLDETLEGEEGDTGNSYYSGDKKDLLLPESQRLLMDKVLATGKPVIVVLMAGSSIDISDADEKADAVLLAWYPGARGGKDVADILFGKVSPSGKLPVTFYKNSALNEMPDFTDYSMNNRTYRYYTGTPLYSFGYGLTYGSCRVTNIELCRDTSVSSGFSFIVTAENTGCIDTEDVMEIYSHDNLSQFAPLNPVLCGFKRISLKAGEKGTFTVHLDPNALTVVSDDGKRIPGSRNITFYASFGCPDKRTEALTGIKPVHITVNDIDEI